MWAVRPERRLLRLRGLRRWIRLGLGSNEREQMRISGWPVTAVLATCAVFSLTGCKPNEAIKRGAVIDKGTKPSEAESPKATVIDPSTTGTLAGTVHFSGKAPERVKIDMSQDPVCSITGGENLA